VLRATPTTRAISRACVSACNWALTHMWNGPVGKVVLA
jgi:hypothetical protein